MDNYLQKLQDIEKANEKAKLTKATLNERLNNLKKEKDEILAKLSEMNINPKDLPSTIQKLEEEIKSEFTKCTKLL